MTFHEHVLDTGRHGLWHADCGDIDGDGLDDILGLPAAIKSVGWHRSRGDGTFDPIQELPGPKFYPSVARLADMDRDGDLDVVLAYQKKGIILLSNDGEGNFAQTSVIEQVVRKPRDLVIADLNGDLQLDIIVAIQIDDSVVWYENTGAGTFTRDTIAVDTMTSPWSVSVGDLDGDFDLDVAFAGTSVRWVENLGAGNFGPANLVTQSRSGQVEIADFNSDGRLDLIHQESVTVLTSRLSWSQNLGQGQFAAPIALTESMGVLRALISTDIDRDNQPDIAFVDSRHGSVEFICSIAKGSSSRASQLLDQERAWTVAVGDFNGDGFPDFVSGGNTRTQANARVFLHAGTLGLSPLRSLLSDSDFLNQAWAADLDRDGLTDLISTTKYDQRRGLAWSRNLGDGSYGDRSVIVSQQTPSILRAADLDGDGRVDPIIGSDGPIFPGVGWHQNLGGGQFTDVLAITRATRDLSDLALADLDNDGDIDVISASRGDHEIARYENLGNGTFGPQRVVTRAASGVEQIAIADLDGDGDLDLASASPGDQKVAWYQNQTGGVFGDQIVLSMSVPDATGIAALDIDRDADMDLLVSSGGNPGPLLIENLGHAGWAAPRTIALGDETAGRLFAIDFNGDGASDLVSLAAGRLSVYPNSLSGELEREQLVGLDYSSAVAQDVDGDGDDDVLATTDREVVLLENLASIRPRIEVREFIAGAGFELALSQFTASGMAEISLSFVGGGPFSNSGGEFLLTPPVFSPSPVAIDAHGQAIWKRPVPTGIRGLTVWLQAIDLSTNLISNGTVARAQ